MSKILDLAKSFKETSENEADSIKMLLRKDLQKLETDIQTALNESSSSLRNVILDRQEALKRDLYDNQQRMSWAVFRSWIWLLVLLGILALGLTGWSAWQIIKISDQSRIISQGKEALQGLPEGMEVAKDKGITYLVQAEKIKTKPEVYQTKTGQWVIKLGK